MCLASFFNFSSGFLSSSGTFGGAFVCLEEKYFNSKAPAFVTAAKMLRYRIISSFNNEVNHSDLHHLSNRNAHDDREAAVSDLAGSAAVMGAKTTTTSFSSSSPDRG